MPAFTTFRSPEHGFEIDVPEKYIFRNTIRGIHVSSNTPFLIAPGAEHWWLVAGHGASMAR